MYGWLRLTYLACAAGSNFAYYRRSALLRAVLSGKGTDLMIFDQLYGVYLPPYQLLFVHPWMTPNLLPIGFASDHIMVLQLVF
jgi:hypothetical protein